jgi:hypothetical protein
MKQISDVENLYNTIQENSHTYQDVVQTEDTQKSIKRWSLISAFYQLHDSNEANSINTKAALRHSKVRPQSLANNIQIPEIAKAENEIFIEEELLLSRSQLATPIIGVDFIKPVQINKKNNALAADISHIQMASSENLTSLFERLTCS